LIGKLIVLRIIDFDAYFLKFVNRITKNLTDKDQLYCCNFHVHKQNFIHKIYEKYKQQNENNIVNIIQEYMVFSNIICNVTETHLDDDNQTSCYGYETDDDNSRLKINQIIGVKLFEKIGLEESDS
jgi:hypothetical protein